MMILGIGFIMVAAMFPVAIRETQETVRETTGTSVAKSRRQLRRPPHQLGLHA